MASPAAPRAAVPTSRHAIHPNPPMPATQNPRLTDPQFQTLRRVVYGLAGIHFQDTKKYVLETRLARRLEELGFDNFGPYLALLTAGPRASDECQEMFNRITINETSFFRNAPQLEVFEQRVLPELLEKRRAAKTLRLWSAACSSGEEPYTLAMIVHRCLGVRLADWKVEILGTDISGEVLGQARTGRYPPYAVRSTEPAAMRRYFTAQGRDFVLDPEIRSMVHFEQFNLKDAYAARRYGIFDAIFCRNVMIYFDPPMKKSCAQMFHKQLADDAP